MMVDQLGIINARNFHDNQKEDIRVINNNKSPFIEYKISDGNQEINNTINKIDPQLARASDLEYLLRSRCWNTPERKFIDCERNLCILKDDGSLDYIPTIFTTDTKGEYRLKKDGDIIKGTVLPRFSPGIDDVIDDIGNIEERSSVGKIISPIEYTRKIVSKFKVIEKEKRLNNKYSDINPTARITEDTQYNLLERNIKKISGNVVDIIKFGSDTYTNIVNLNNYLEIKDNSVDSTQKTLAKLGIMYTKNLRIYSKEISFYPFIFMYDVDTQEKYAQSDNFIQEVNDDVVIEFINGCARVFPLHNNITECIISFCYLNYE